MSKIVKMKRLSRIIKAFEDLEKIEKTKSMNAHKLKDTLIQEIQILNYGLPSSLDQIPFLYKNRSRYCDELYKKSASQDVIARIAANDAKKYEQSAKLFRVKREIVESCVINARVSDEILDFIAVNKRSTNSDTGKFADLIKGWGIR